MTALEKYDKLFMDSFLVMKKELEGLNYRGIAQWDSIGHMDLMSAMEECFGVTISTLDVLDFSSYRKGKEILAKYGVEL